MNSFHNNQNNHNESVALSYDRLTWLNLIAYLLNVLVTYGIGVLGGGGGWDLPTNAELSEKYQTLVTPAGFAFAIWGIIFLAQFVWVIIPFLPSIMLQDKEDNNNNGNGNGNEHDNDSNNHNNDTRNDDDPNGSSSSTTRGWILAVGYEYLWVCLVQIGWTLSFTFELIPVSVIMMLLLWTFLHGLVRNLYNHRRRRRRRRGTIPYAPVSSSLSLSSTQQNVKEYILWFFPFTVHLGWITAASVVNFNVLLVALHASPTYRFRAAVVSLIVLFVVTLRMLRYDYVIPTVVAWALYGIYSELGNPKESITETFTEEQIHFIRVNVVVAIVLILTLVAAKWISSQQQQQQQQQQQRRHDEQHRSSSNPTSDSDEDTEVENSIAEERVYLRAPDGEEVTHGKE